jgi:T5SS/PEP-CTERM-associated repeat protein
VRAAITTTGSVTPDPNTTTASDRLYIGNTADGTLLINGGSDVVSSGANIAYGPAVSGSATVDGAGSTWTSTFDVQIGGSAGSVGVLAITNGGLVTDAAGDIVQTGSVTVSGGAKWVNTNTLSVRASSGLSVLSGGQVSDQVAYVGLGGASASSVLVSGVGSTWTSAVDLSVGYLSNAVLTVRDSGQLVSPNAYLGYVDHSAGSVEVTDPGSAWSTTSLYIGYFGTGSLSVTNGGKASGFLYVGNAGSGTLSITAGGKVTGSGIIGSSLNSTGSATVDGSNSSWSNGSLIVGNSGNGGLTISNGGLVSSSTGKVGALSSSTGTVTVTGASSIWTNAGALGIGSSGTGSLSIAAGGQVTDASADVGLAAGAIGTVTVDGIGSSWTTNGALTIGSAGRGTLSIKNGASVAAATTTLGNANAATAINFDGGTLSTGTFFGSANRLLGNGTINTHGLVTDCSVTIDSASALQQQILLNSLPGQNVTINLNLDGSGPLGVGYAGLGTLSITGGAVVSSPISYLGYLSGSTGNATVSGAGSKWTTINELFVGNAGNGSLNLADGGQVGAKRVLIANTNASTASVALSGPGTQLNSSTSIVVGGVGYGSLDIAGGASVSCQTAIIANGANFASIATVSGSGSTWSNAGLLIVGSNGNGSLNITSGGQVSDTTAIIAAQTTSTSVATVSGSGSKWTNSGNLTVGSAGRGTLSITNGGSVTDSSGQVGTLATVIVDGAGSTWANSAKLDVNGILSITSGGQLSSYDGDVFNAGAVTVDGVGSMWTSTTMRIENNNVSLVNQGKLLVAGDTVLSDTVSSSVTFNNGILTTGSFIGSSAQLKGTGTLNTHGLIADFDLVIDQTHASSQQIVFNDQPDQNVLVNLDINGSGSLGAGFAGHGTLTVADGKTINSAGGYVGYLIGSTGAATVSGTGSAWNTSGTMYVGYQGNGALNITNGGHVSSSSTVVGWDFFSKGAANIDGPGSSLSTGTLDVYGPSQSSTLTVSNGGTVSSAGATIYQGAVIVSGVGSAWMASDFLIVGGDVSPSTLTISAGGHVSNVDGYVGLYAPSSVTVQGAGSQWTSSGSLALAAYGTQTTVQISTGGTVDVGSDLSLGVDGSNGTSTINLAGGTLRLHGGTISKGTGTAALNFTSGRLEGARKIHLGAPFLQNGGTLAPGNSAGTTTIDGGYTLDAGNLEIEITGPGGPGVGFDQVKVNGVVDLLGTNGLANGVLDIHLSAAPAVGQGFIIVSNDGIDPVIGAFADGPVIRVPYGDFIYEFTVDYAAAGNDIGMWTTGAQLFGDYNSDGTVDAGDFAVWRKARNSATSAYSGADGSGDGTVNDADYTIWRTHFGNTAAARGMSLASGSIPEPASVTLLLGAILTTTALSLSRRCRAVSRWRNAANMRRD